MSLLRVETNENRMRMTQKIFDLHFERNPSLHQSMDDRGKRLMLQDIYHNIDNIQWSVQYHSSDLVKDYVDWLMGLLAYRMKSLNLERLKQVMIEHYGIVKEVLVSEVEEQHRNKTEEIIDLAIEQIQVFELIEFSYLEDIPYKNLAYDYLYALLDQDRRKATDLILEGYRSGISLQDIYLGIFRPVMYEVGNLWYQNKITVDKEHYVTAMTQGVMSMLYPYLFNTPKHGKTMVALCVGSELHEMGIRMLCDLFEIAGWDTIYLGAAVPIESLMVSLDEYQPDLIVLSVTMIDFVKDCKDMVEAIRSKSSLTHVKIAAGGKALEGMENIKKDWPIDTMASTYEDLLSWTEKHIKR